MSEYKNNLDERLNQARKELENQTQEAEYNIKSFKTALKEKYKDNEPITEDDMSIDSVFEAAQKEASAHNGLPPNSLKNLVYAAQKQLEAEANIKNKNSSDTENVRKSEYDL